MTTAIAWMKKMTIVPLIMIVFALKGMSMSQNIVKQNGMNFNNVDDESESESSSEENLDSSCLKNMHWCICQECSIMPSLVKSKVL